MKVTASKYNSIHVWLKKEYGKAVVCENSECTRQSTIFHWALKKECSHDFNRENYLNLCIKCHARYDREHGLLGMKEDDNLVNIRMYWETYMRLKKLADARRQSIIVVLDELIK